MIVLLAAALALDGPELAARLREARLAAEFSVRARLVRVDEAGARTTYRISAQGKPSPGANRVLYAVTQPALRIAIEYRGAGAPKLVPTRTGYFLDTELAYEDLTDAYVWWNNQVLAGIEKYGARTCYVLKSRPGAGDASDYSEVTSWVDREALVPVFVQKRLRQSGALKEFLFYGLQRSRGQWGPRQVEVRMQGGRSRTLLIVRGQ